MIDNPYQVLGASTPALIGRERPLQWLTSRLGKRTPDHVSVVGPKYIGKTVLLGELARRFSGGGSPFAACVYWDLRRETFDDDAAFFRALARRMATALDGVDATLAKHLRTDGGDAWGMVQIAAEGLADERERVLVVLDNLDVLPLSEGLSKTVWDNLRALAELPSVWFVTGTRRTLRELPSIRPEEWYTSDFHRIFADNVLRLGAFEDGDLDALLAPLRAHVATVGKGFKTELAATTGGVPILAVQVLKHVWDGADPSGSVTHDDVHEATAALAEPLRGHLKDLWEACSDEEQSDLARVAFEGEIELDATSRHRAEVLARRGFLVVSGSRAKSQCRLMDGFAREHGASATSLNRLFEAEEDLHANMKAVLGYRLTQIAVTDPALRDYLDTAIDRVDKPHVLLAQIRSITDRVLQIVMDAECPDGEIPVEWTREWHYHLDSDAVPKGPAPVDSWGRLAIIRLATDTRNGVATRISRPTSILLNALHHIGNFGQHKEGDPLYKGFALNACLSALELVNQVSQELSGVSVALGR